MIIAIVSLFKTKKKESILILKYQNMDTVCVCVCVHMRCFVYARKIVHSPILFECGKCGKKRKEKEVRLMPLIITPNE